MRNCDRLFSYSLSVHAAPAPPPARLPRLHPCSNSATTSECCGAQASSRECDLTSSLFQPFNNSSFQEAFMTPSPETKAKWDWDSVAARRKPLPRALGDCVPRGGDELKPPWDLLWWRRCGGAFRSSQVELLSAVVTTDRFHESS